MGLDGGVRPFVGRLPLLHGPALQQLTICNQSSAYALVCLLIHQGSSAGSAVPEIKEAGREGLGIEYKESHLPTFWSHKPSSPRALQFLSAKILPIMSSTKITLTEAEVSNAFKTRELAVLYTSISERERTPKYSNTSTQIGNVLTAHEIKFSAEAEESAATAQESSRIPRAPPGTSSKFSIRSDVFNETKQVGLGAKCRFEIF